jgi:hypothetical protein
VCGPPDDDIGDGEAYYWAHCCRQLRTLLQMLQWNWCATLRQWASAVRSSAHGSGIASDRNMHMLQPRSGVQRHRQRHWQWSGVLPSTGFATKCCAHCRAHGTLQPVEGSSDHLYKSSRCEAPTHACQKMQGPQHRQLQHSCRYTPSLGFQCHLTAAKGVVCVQEVQQAGALCSSVQVTCCADLKVLAIGDDFAQVEST